MALDTRPRTPDGEQLLIYPYIPPEERKAVLNEMALDGSSSPLVRGLVARALRDLPANPSTEAVFQRLLNLIYETVQYVPDPAADLDYYQPVIITLRPSKAPGWPISPVTGAPKGTGDCEDSSVLYAAFVWAAGAILGRPYRGVVDWLSQPGKPQNHVPAMACPTITTVTDTAGNLASGCLWAETTLPGARIGEHPYEALARLGGTEKVEGAYVPVNSSGDPAPEVIERDGQRLVYDHSRARNGVVSGWAFPSTGLPYPVTITL